MLMDFKFLILPFYLALDVGILLILLWLLIEDFPLKRSSFEKSSEWIDVSLMQHGGLFIGVASIFGSALDEIVSKIEKR